jgi:hypothetical protein
MKDHYENLGIKEVPFGFGWVFEDDSSTDTICGVLEKADSKVKIFLLSNKLLEIEIKKALEFIEVNGLLDAFEELE